MAPADWAMIGHVGDYFQFRRACQEGRSCASRKEVSFFDLFRVLSIGLIGLVRVGLILDIRGWGFVMRAPSSCLDEGK